jgi:hypothetical protein
MEANPDSNRAIYNIELGMKRILTKSMDAMYRVIRAETIKATHHNQSREVYKKHIMYTLM